METRSKATRDQALSEAVSPPAEFPARIGEATPESGDLGDIGAAGIVGDSRPSSTRPPPTGVISPHLSVHEADVDGPPLLQRADLAPISNSTNLRPLHWFLVNLGNVYRIGARPQRLAIIILLMSVLIICYLAMLILQFVMLVMLDLHFVALGMVLHCIILRFADLVSMIWPGTVQDRFAQ